MAKMWTGMTSGQTSKLADDFNSSLHFDRRMYRQDIQGSMAHAAMLADGKIISAEDAAAIEKGLQSILSDLDSGVLTFDRPCEDIHMFVEEVLTERIGEPGKKLHTARSRNDQVALDLRMYLRDEAAEIQRLTGAVIQALVQQAEAGQTYIMPGYTHLQRAQPILFAHHLLAYAMMLLRDTGRIGDAVRRMNLSPIGCCALAGTTFAVDRQMEADALGFDGVCPNSIDGVSDRDFCLELLSAFSIEMMHLSRLSEELILWSSLEFCFVRLDDAYTTGSSIMPQKKNSDMAELVRGKTGRVYGDLMALLTALKGLPLAYNKDMQEDKEAVFDAVDTVKMCLGIMAPMLETMKPLPENMKNAARQGFINATDLADHLTKKGMPFRTAYKVAGNIVADCMEKGFVLETYPLAEYRRHSELFGEDVFDAVDLRNCVSRRISQGGTGPASVAAQIEFVKRKLAETALPHGDS